MDLSVNDLKHTYSNNDVDERPVFEVNSWQIQSGTQILLRGISGSGKTTFLNILAGLMTPTKGEICMGKQSLYALPEAKRDRFRADHIGYIFQTHLLAPHLTAIENVEMPLIFSRKLPTKERKERAQELLTQAGLGNRLDRVPAQLSVGQRLRVAVVRALVSAPKLLLADEPTASLDARSAEVVMDLMQNQCKAQNAILIVASHDPLLATRFDRIVDLRKGNIYGIN